MSDNREFGDKVLCFASNAAVQVEATIRHRGGVGVAETISVEMCPVNNQRPNWAQKIGIQLSEDELPVYVAVLLGYLPKCEFKRPEKGVFIERQQGRMYYRGTAGQGHLFQVPVPIGKTFNMGQLALKQLCSGLTQPNGELVLAGIKGSAALYKG